MVPCAISWCVALTQGQNMFCPIHMHDQALHPREVDLEEDAYDNGYKAGLEEGRTEGRYDD